jgi:hypothetical protein
MAVDLPLELMADEELARACTLSWLALSKVTPWGDTYEGFAPSGRPVEIERNYVWAEEPGGDVLVEVNVFANAVQYDQGAKRSQRIKKPA